MVAYGRFHCITEFGLIVSMLCFYTKSHKTCCSGFDDVICRQRRHHQNKQTRPSATCLGIFISIPGWSGNYGMSCDGTLWFARWKLILAVVPFWNALDRYCVPLKLRSHTFSWVSWTCCLIIILVHWLLKLPSLVCLFVNFFVCLFVFGTGGAIN